MSCILLESAIHQNRMNFQGGWGGGGRGGGSHNKDRVADPEGGPGDAPLPIRPIRFFTCLFETKIFASIDRITYKFTIQV